LGLLLADDEIEFDDVDATEVEPERDVDGTRSVSAISSSISGSIHARKLVLLVSVQHYLKNLSLTLQNN
jgi:hypothetical protein